MRVSSLDLGAASADPYITSFIPPEQDLRGLGACESCRTKSIIDQPYSMREAYAGIPMARSVGYIMSIPQLAGVNTKSTPSLAMTRANNLASLTAATLLRFKPEVRLQVIESVGGVAWTQDVLKLSKNVPGGLGITDAVRFGLAMHFLVGILELEKGEDTADARAYVEFAKVFKDAEKRVDNGTASPALPMKLQGLDDLGAVNGLGLDLFGAIKSGLSKAADAVVGAVKSVGNKISEGVDKVVDFASDAICKGLKGILGEYIGGGICWIITKGFEIIKNAIKTIIEIIKVSVESLGKFIKELVSGNIMKAVMALMEGVSQIVFLLFAPVAVTFLYPGNKAKEGFEELKEVGRKVAKKNPFFPISLALAIFGLVTSAAAGAAGTVAASAASAVPGAGGAPNPLVTAISTLILALSPAIGVLLAKLLKKIDMLKDMAIEKLEDSVEKFVKIALVVFNGFLALRDILPRLRTSVEKFLKKRGGVAGTIKTAGGKAMDGLSASWEKVVTALKSLKLAEMSTALSALFALVPAVLGGMFEDTNSEIPEIAETVKAVKDSETSVNQQQKALQQAQKDFLKEMPLEQRRAVVMDQATQLQPQQAGITTARLMKQAFKEQQNKEAFIAAFRTEFVKA